MIRVLYFALLRERMGRGEENLPLPPSIATVGDLASWLHGRDPAGAAAFAAGNPVRAAVNQEFAKPDTPLRDGDEVAFFPPVTGG
jgi:sulfur-carrier protein